MRNTAFTGTRAAAPEEPSVRRLLADLRASLQAKLPAGWSVDSAASVSTAQYIRTGLSPDASFVISAPDGSTATVIVAWKPRVEAREVPRLAQLLSATRVEIGAQAGLVAAPFLSPRTRQVLVQQALSYADSTGNLRLALERPALYIEASGADSDPWANPTPQHLRSLKGPTAGRVVRALCDFRPPYSVRQLAERSNTPLGSVARVFDLLEAEALLIREPRGPVTDVRWAELLQRWTADYDFARANRVRTFLEPRGLPPLVEKLKAVPWRYAITGSLAAVDVAAIAAPRLATVYVDDTERAASELRLRPADAGANVVLAEPFDSVVYDRTREWNGSTYAAFSQVAADLLTSPGRGPAEGEELLRWMASHEDAWRS